MILLKNHLHFKESQILLKFSVEGVFLLFDKIGAISFGSIYIGNPVSFLDGDLKTLVLHFVDTSDFSMINFGSISISESHILVSNFSLFLLE